MLPPGPTFSEKGIFKGNKCFSKMMPEEHIQCRSKQLVKTKWQSCQTCIYTLVFFLYMQWNVYILYNTYSYRYKYNVYIYIYYASSSRSAYRTKTNLPESPHPKGFAHATVQSPNTVKGWSQAFQWKTHTANWPATSLPFSWLIMI